MDVLIPGCRYELWQLGGGTQILDLGLGLRHTGAKWGDVAYALVERTWYLNEVRPCNETASAAEFLEMVAVFGSNTVHTTDDGHIYEFSDAGQKQRLVFVKRSSDSIRYEKEWPGVQSQEVMRALIDHLEYRRYTLGENILIHEGLLAEDFIRDALFFYEVRAYRRKRDGVNRKRSDHDGMYDPKVWRHYPFADVPFGPAGIEMLPIGEDGHVVPEVV